MDEPGFALHDARVAIVGLGLMGGSLALALRAKNTCAKIIAVEKNETTREHALARGAVDQASADLSLVAQADVIILATPVRAIVELLPEIGAVARDGAIIIDLGSTKCEITQMMNALPSRVQPIGGHPMCGKESAGFDAADENLFRNAVFVLAPIQRTAPQTLAFAESIVQTIGARPLVIDAARHDKIVAAVSHLPYVVAATLMTTANELADSDDLLFVLAASGFRDTSRLAASDTTMMGDVLLTNSENVSATMRDYARYLSALADLIEQKNENELRVALESAAVKRRTMFK